MLRGPAMSRLKQLIHEIHRRSLWQVLAVYLAGSWVALQVVNEVVESVSLPAWVSGAAVVLLVIGFPIVLATAFVQEGAGRRAEDASSEPEPAGVRTAASYTPPRAPLDHRSVRHRLFTWRNAIAGGVTAFALLGLVTAGWLVMRTLGIGPAATLVARGVLPERATILLADFTGSDPTLARAATEALRVDLSQSPVLRLAEPEFVTDALRRMERGPETPLDLPLARELAVREGVPAVLAGAITPVGSRFILTAQLVAAPGGDVLLSSRETATDEEGIVPALDRLSHSLRERIGEPLRSLRAAPPLARVTTGKIEALQRYSQAVHVSNALGDLDRAADLLEQVVAMDSTFAMAWRKLGMVRSNLAGGPAGDHAAEHDALTRAFQLRDRLTERESYLATAAYYASVEDDERRAADAYENLLELDPEQTTALNNLAILYLEFRDAARAEELLRRALAVDSTSYHYYQNLVRALVPQAQYDEAWQTMAAWQRNLPGNPAALQLAALLAASSGDYPTADRYAEELGRMAAGDLLREFQASAVLLATASVRGRLREAEFHARAVEDTQRRRGATSQAFFAALVPAFLALDLRDEAALARRLLNEALASHPLEEIPVVNRPNGILITFHARLGQPERARELLAEWEAGDPAAAAGEGPDRALGWILLAEGDIEGALARFRDTERGGCLLCSVEGLMEAYDQAGVTDSAIAWRERYVETDWIQRLFFDQGSLGPTLERLGQLYDERGDLENAAKYYAQFVELWADADPELQPRVKAAQQRLEEILAARG